MADNNNGPTLVEVAQTISIISSSVIELKNYQILSQANVDKANEILAIFLDKVEAAVSTINLVDSPAPEPTPDAPSADPTPEVPIKG